MQATGGIEHPIGEAVEHRFADGQQMGIGGDQFYRTILCTALDAV